jgi:hypothetical protein
MAKKKIRRQAKTVTRKVKTAAQPKSILTIIKGWMFVVAFALMLGIGAIVGTYFSQLMNENTPTVAGAQISR